MEKLGPGDPQRIGAYRMLARLGAGGMGQVYLARSDRGRTVAVKLVREELAARDEFRARFRQEVQAARQVGGYWTAPVIDADTEAAVPWVVTGYVAGPSLQQVVGHDHGALPERSVRILGAGLANALKDIHAAGIVHRDLKPSNVLVTIDGPRVIDFGIARALETVTDGGLTRTGALVGSPGFMAPEQVRGDRITPACDVFCLGSVLAYAATGRLPFGTADSGVHALMFRIAQEEPDLEGVPEGIADLVRACLKKEPGARPTLERILERTAAEDTVFMGRSRDPWLPGVLVAQLGRHAVRLLDTEDPEGVGGGAGPAPGVPPGVSPEASPEHAAVADGPSPSLSPNAPPLPNQAPGAPSGPPVPGEPGSGGRLDHLPTVVTGQGGPGAPPAPSPPVPAHPAYGYPQQHPQPSAYGYPQQPGTPPPYNHPPHPYGGLGQTPPHGPPPTAVTPYSGPPEPGRNRRSTAVLVLVALVVALAAGGSVYALLSGDGDGGGEAAGGTTTPSATAPTTPGRSTPEEQPSPSQPTTSAPPSDGTIPADYLGTWTTTIDNADGLHTRELTLRQGETGDTVLSLVADGPTANGTYHCVFQADLAEEPSGEGPLSIGPSTVTSGQPRSSCSPGTPTEITLLPDGSLERTNTGTDERLTYTRQ
ncbi:serine/threonine-protein kinase [Streptomyces sp. NBC_01373]|uniref:serine/threonine-protein kinase n=1 Tax=Streptomyces sp. NBC_01373 TaxID=2903843 RepID=UPI00224CE1C7|nr:serine/threonine-protein kinase [Streptomyces sp. NBC_01373]MCX4699132.1 serine/threonine protein kinase [Streptomyces sp. NBC_01373]